MESIISIIITMCHHHHLSDSIWRRFWQGRRIFQHIPPFFTSVHPPLSSLSLKSSSSSSSSSSSFSNHHRSYHILHILLSPLPVWRCFASKAITAAHENIRCVRKHNEKKQKMHTCASSTHCCSLSPRKQDGDSERRTRCVWIISPAAPWACCLSRTAARIMQTQLCNRPVEQNISASATFSNC